MTDFEKHPMTCGKCGAEVSGRKCDACGHDHVPIHERLATAEAEMERLKEEVDLHKSRAICELADEGDEAAHECGWVVCGCCWNNVCAAHKKVADQLKEQLVEARAELSTITGQLAEARAECERLRKLCEPVAESAAETKWWGEVEAAAAGGPDDRT